MPELSSEQRLSARERVRQLFRFLKAYAERRQSLKRTLAEHEWTLRLRDLPAHPCVVIGHVLLNGAEEEATEVPGNGTLLTIRRPRLTNAPTPPKLLEEWLEKGWQEPGGEIRVRTEIHVQRGDQTVAEPFTADEQRPVALAEWRARWEAWAEAERPARAAMKAFERLYQLYSRIGLESERVELTLGDGQLRWQRDAEHIDHPVLLQRVQLEFDADVPELRLRDADRAPELYSALLTSAEGIPPQQLTQLRRELETRGYHPLEREATGGYLNRLAQQLGPRGVFRDKPQGGPVTADPVIERDPVLFLRQRVLGYAAAFDRVLEDLEADDVDIPAALIRLVGVEPPPEPEGEMAPHSPWGEPPDILLSKPANAEQIAIARALERHRAVQVQGPPGTGKSHTIANLIGHLVANGKRVLVTSHTTKALRVLRQHIVEPLRPLAVAVLENDLEGRRQMEEAVRQILAKLTESAERLARDAERLSADRVKLNAAIDEVTHQLEDARAAEYRSIVVSGKAYTPAEAARLVRSHQEGNDWIPGPVTHGAPLPLSVDEIADLYASNVLISQVEERELEGGLPNAGAVPNGQEFARLVAQAADTTEGDGQRYWTTEPDAAQISSLDGLHRMLSTIGDEVARLAPWEREVVKAGHAGGNDVKLWHDLAQQVRAAYGVWDQTKPLLIEHAPQIPDGVPTPELTAIYGEIVVHLSQGGTLGWITLLTRSAWKLVIRDSRVNDNAPSAAEHFRALKAAADLHESRRKLKSRWGRQAVPAGLPSFDSFGATPEPALQGFARRIEARLKTWQEWWRPLEQALDSAGLRWRQVRDDAIARSGPREPFDLDLDLLVAALPRLVGRRLAVCRSLHASRLLREIEARLAKFRGPIVSALRNAVRTRDPEKYAMIARQLERLREQSPIFEQRRARLANLQTAALAWASAIRDRTPPHDTELLPGDPAQAWLWRQLYEELERRSKLDEQALIRRLGQLQADLRRITAELIECQAWRAQVARVGLRARQALQGWADTQRRIGRGAGRRVPELLAEARRMLDQARDAVPVWIMPLARVAESFQSSGRRFDVVIVDEASQADVTGLLAWYLGERVLVVGDDEQVSPLDVGQDAGSAAALIAEHLGNVPNAHLYDGRASIYNLAGQCFGGTIRLREHFRCMPAIIEFSNRLAYNGDIRPLRNPASAPLPHVVEYVVPQTLRGKRDGKRNEAEARILVALFKAMASHPQYRGKTFGAISLVGDEQAALVQELALEALGAVELESRRFAAGSAAQFQGDERDVVLLSMVDASVGTPLRMRQEPQFKQRFNVAASRARDQLWLVHSLDPERDLKPGDLRRELVAHVRDPEARLRKERETLARAESPFEEEVIRRLIAAGYEVTPQVWVGSYRIDMVVGSGQLQVAVECDGDRFHGIDQIPADMVRQAILERAGWRFIRIRGTRFYRDPDATMAWVTSELEKLGIGRTASMSNQRSNAGAELRDEIERRMWEVLRDLQWIPAQSDMASNELPLD